MKRSLRQDAEHRNPKVDLVWFLFSSGVCWHLPVPSAIIKKTSVIPPIVGSLSQASFAVGHEITWCHLHTPLSLLGVAVSFCPFYAGRLSFLPFNTEGRDRKIDRQKPSLFSSWLFFFCCFCAIVLVFSFREFVPFLGLIVLLFLGSFWVSFLFILLLFLLLLLKYY